MGVKRNDDENPIKPNMFYKEGVMKIRCPPEREVYDRRPHGDHPSVPIEDWPIWANLGTRLEVYRLIRGRQHSCISCRCDDRGGMWPRLPPPPPKNGGPPGTGGDCHGQTAADRCAVILGCFCFATLTQPTATNLAATLENYQDAINQIPGTVRESVKNKYWSWRMHGLNPNPGQMMRWTNNFNEVLDDIARDMAVPYGDVGGGWITEPVPNIHNEPYFEDGEEDFEWARHEYGYYGPRYGPGPGSGSGSGPIAKRESTDVDRPTCGVNEGPRRARGHKPSSQTMGLQQQLQNEAIFPPMNLE
ncbi:hypothetical protein TWF569_007180 [Orbilia oligospora]|uniref:Uncharacterized protein n=1 Tax=Orbilia oligospora TaxID=2813651 RepID=A0A7C8JDY1_ORBOL|nr:hypothetical protein TWF103_002244 [Orbilia oligospora]KAF3086522.1 hypothetical protein TWF706_011664 [Orbilia oligospora]KAF3106994.1 hypothetical protein TWF102_000839 [Orbilia oligospora]KAF3119640.1 hypothetical protein TWF594_004615 [Orbilia oligospora]KAF3126088.1 hypothetical protein TWF703_010549 [Orbilia oligospora]